METKLRKPPVSLTLIILPEPLLITTLTPIAQFIPTPTLGHRALPTQTQSNPYHHQDTISVGSTLLYNHPPPSTIQRQNHQPIAKIESNTHDHFSFLYEKIINLQHQLDNTATGENKNKSMIIHKKQRWPQATKPTTTNKNYNNKQGRSPTVPTTATCKNDKGCQGQQQQRALHTPQVPLSPSQAKPPATKTVRIIQPNNLLKVLTANVQSLPPKIDELIALMQVENFDVIALNETWLDTENKHLLAEIAIHGYNVRFFMWTNQLHQQGEVDQPCMSKTP